VFAIRHDGHTFDFPSQLGRGVDSNQFAASATPAFDRADRRKPVAAASGAGAGAAGAGRWAAGLRAAGAARGATTGTAPCRCGHGAIRVGSCGHGAIRVGSCGACWLRAGHSSRRGGVRGGVRGGEGVGLAVLDDRELLELESESDGGAAGSNGKGIATPSESVESETSSSSGERSASPGSAARPKRSGMASCATRDRPGNSSFHTTSRETIISLRPPLADGSHSFQPLKSSGQSRKTHGLAWSWRLFRSLR
jgi:hypothetical protein